jgi:NADH dehydrogenase
MPRVVILGGGFGGVYTATHLERLTRRRPGVEILLVSRDNYFLMTPLLFEAGSGVLDFRHAVNPIRPLLHAARFMNAAVERIDLDRRVVHAALDDAVYEVPYDQLVLALGAMTNKSRIPGSEHAMTFKTLADAVLLRNQVIDVFERADVEPDAARRQALMTFVVIGGGLVGVELVGELTEYVERMRRQYRRAAQTPARLELIEAAPRVLPEMDPELADYAVKLFETRGVRVRTATPVARIEPGRVHLPDGEVIEAATVLLAAGLDPNPVVQALPLEKDRIGRVVTEPTMRVKGRPEVWALGDCASIPDPQGKPYPTLAQHALREARVLARNVAATLPGGSGGPLEPFVYKTLGTLAALGHYRGIGRILWVRVRGFLAWWVWRTYYVMQMPRWERRFRVILDWTVALFFAPDAVKLDMGGEGRAGGRPG